MTASTLALQDECHHTASWHTSITHGVIEPSREEYRCAFPLFVKPVTNTIARPWSKPVHSATMSNFLNKCCVTWFRGSEREAALPLCSFRPALLSCSHGILKASTWKKAAEDTVHMYPKGQWFRAYAVQQLSLHPDLIHFPPIQYHVVLSTDNGPTSFPVNMVRPIADLVRQAAYPLSRPPSMSYG